MIALTDNLRGAALMSAAMAAFTINDTFLKALADDLPLFQTLFLRGVVVTLALAGAVMVTRSPVRLAGRDWWFVTLRTAGETAAAYLFVTALFHAPLANMTAILQALPLSVTLAAALFLGEPIGLPRLLAILVGFVGVLLIVRPGMAGFNVYSVYALGAVAAVTLRDLATRRLSPNTPSLTVALVGSAGVTLFTGLGSATIEWRAVGPAEAAQLGASCAFIFLAYLLSVMVMRVGAIGFVSPFRYTGLVWALILGFVIFGDWPDAVTLLGAGIVVSTGVFTLWRERRVARRMLAARARPGV